jgi:hypothetical protein
MEILARELQETTLDHNQRSWILKQIAAEIRNSLQTRLPIGRVQERSRKLQQTLDRPCEFACEEALELLASAVADEADGLSNSVQSLMSWMADPACFSQNWVKAMHEEVKTLRQEVATEL